MNLSLEPFSKIDPELVISKLERLEQYLEELEEIRDISFEEYMNDHFRKRGIERLIQLSVECATDINSYLLSKVVKVVPSDYQDSFLKAGRHSILPPEFAHEIAPSAGLRNRLVHEYDEIDDRIVHRSIRKTLKQYAQYIKHIRDFLSKLES